MGMDKDSKSAIKSGRNERTSSRTVLVLRWDDSNIDNFVALFEKQGFTVESRLGPMEVADQRDVGALVHLARSPDALVTHLGEEHDRITAEEWLLVSGDGEDDFHCTVQLTDHASLELRKFVRWLWALASVV